MSQITPFMQSVLGSIDEISTKLDQNIFIKNARTAFKENISQFEIADDEKAKLTANYEAQVSIATISEIIKLAKETPLDEAQISLINKDIEIKTQQKLSMIEEDRIKTAQSAKDIELKSAQIGEANKGMELKSAQISLINKDIEIKTQQKLSMIEEDRIKSAQIREIDKDIEIKTQQEKIAKEQVSGEKAKTKLMLQQVVTEQYRHRDLRASIKVKIASNEVTKQQAKFEEARRHIAIQSNNQNTFMKKADYKVQQLQALAQDDKVVISAEQISDTKTTIEAIPTQIISYNTEVQVDSINIPDTEIITPVINCEE